VSSLVVWTVGNGVAPLLPVYAAQLGAGPALIGTYLAFSYLALATGTLIAGWLSDRLQSRKALIIVGGAVNVPAIWLMGRATNVWQLAALTGTVWFGGGTVLALVSILTGLFAEPSERGRLFGILSLTGALGSLLGGLATGPMADRWGYPTMFAILALFWSLSPLVALLLEDKVVVPVRDGDPSGAGEASGFGGSFHLLLLASVLIGLSYFVAVLSRSLVMDALGFGASAISGTGAVGGAVTLPLPALLGWLSDRMSRKRLLIGCCLVGAVGVLALALAASLWHFWVVMSLVSVLFCVSGVGSAMVTDLVGEGSLGRGLSLFTATTWVGAVLGFAGTGYAIQRLGLTPTVVVGASLPLVAVALLIPIREGGAGRSRLTPPSP
jgi:DHA1 family bicyclomycin/chloramphenicol resistance-like MFS transporter